MIKRPVPTVNNVLPNQIDGRFFPIFETTNPEMMQNVADTRVYGSILDSEREQARNASARKAGT